LRPSFEYRQRHIKGSFFLTRENLNDDIKSLPDVDSIILLTNNLSYAQLVGIDLEKTGRNVHLLDGDFNSWCQADKPTSSGLENLISRPVDTYLEADHFEDPVICIREHHAYLNWEIALIDHIVGDPAVRYTT